LLLFYGAKGDIMAPATIFLSPVIVSVPFLALSMMGNTIIRAEGQATFAMVSMIIPALVNIALDFVFIKLLDLGLWSSLQPAFPISRLFFYSWYFIYKTELKLQAKDFKFHLPIIKEITSLSLFSRQGVVSILAIILNHTLYSYGGEHSIIVYGIISKTLIFALFRSWNNTRIYSNCWL
jgi:Na+-driven multidrug efflux pump